MRSYHPDVKFNIVNSVHKNRVVSANLLGRFIVSMQQGWNRCIPARSAGPWQTRSEGTVTVLHTTPTTHIADSSPALERPSNASSRYTALERAILALAYV